MTRLENDPRLRFRRWGVFVGLVGFVAALFTLVNGNAVLTTAFDGDEVRQVESLSGVSRPELGLSRWSLWSFFEGTEAELATLRQGVFEGDEAWCTVVEEPRPKMTFFRPLSSLSLALDHDLFGHRPFGYHLQQLLWYFAVLTALAAVLRRAFHDESPNAAFFPPLAAAALLVFAFDATHAETIGRVATRHLLMSTFFGLTAVYGHMVARARRSWKRMEFTAEQWHGLKEHAKKRGLDFLSSPFSMEAVELLTRVGVVGWKVASGEINNAPLIDAMASTGLPLMLSTGMSPLAEIDSAVEQVQRHGVPLTASNPTKPPSLVGHGRRPAFAIRRATSLRLASSYILRVSTASNPTKLS